MNIDDDDGMLLNISMGKSNKNNNINKGQTIKKTDAKKMKYSRRARENRSASSKSAGRTGLLGTGDSADRKIGGWDQAAVQSSLAKQTNQKSDGIKKQYKTKRARPSDTRQHSRSKRQFSHSKAPINAEFNVQKIVNVKVPQLLQQDQHVQNKIDRTELDEFKLMPKIQQSLLKSGVTKLTDIQVKCYSTLFNQKDAVVKASTGSGKTLAYLIPVINRMLSEGNMLKREDGTIVMVLCPTRQLCVQGQVQATRCLKRTPYIVAGCLYGGQDTNHQKARLRKGTNILFCTPGRVLYHLQHTQSFKLTNLKCLIFQQADRTLDMGFQQSVQKILTIIQSKLPLSHLHKILVSAHFNTKVSSLIQTLSMNESNFIGFQDQPQMNLDKLKRTKDNQINTSSQLKQQYVLLSEDQKIPLMLSYVGVLSQSKVLIFVSTIDEVEFIDYLLCNLKYRDSNGVPTETRLENRPVFKIHGDLDQKLRSKTYLEFRAAKEAILISTEVASRGLDFPDLSHIILFDVPPTITDYGNRVGRSARFNQTGVSLLMLHYQQSDYAQKIRYYSPNLEVIDKDVIYESYSKILKSLNIGDRALHYLQGLVRSAVKDDDEKYQIARKAYVSMLRAYARLPDRNVFAVKNLNLKLLARTFGLNSAKAGQDYNPKAKTSHLEASRKKRRVEDVKRLQVSQYM